MFADLEKAAPPKRLHAKSFQPILAMHKILDTLELKAGMAKKYGWNLHTAYHDNGVRILGWQSHFPYFASSLFLMNFIVSLQRGFVFTQSVNYEIDMDSECCRYISLLLLLHRAAKALAYAGRSGLESGRGLRLGSFFKKPEMHRHTNSRLPPVRMAERFCSSRIDPTLSALDFHQNIC